MQKSVMNKRTHLLISLEPRHATSILAGTKSVELRRRTMRINTGDLVWLYAKKPIGAVVGYAVVSTCVESAPSSVWRQYGSVSGILKTEFATYFDGAASAFAVELSSPKTLRHPVNLDDLRTTIPDFHPPQFYCRLTSKSALQNLLTERSSSR